MSSIQITTLIELNNLDELIAVYKRDEHINSYFSESCKNGHLEMAQWLYSFGGVDIHANNEKAFRFACYRGHLEVAQWLYSLGGVDIHAHNDTAFTMCNYIIKNWLYSLDSEYYKKFCIDNKRSIPT